MQPFTPNNPTQPMQIIDTHSHLDTHQFHDDYRKVLSNARKTGVVAQILPGVCLDWLPNLLSMCHREHDLFAAPGLHPLYLNMHTASHLKELHEYIESGDVVALGEIGLDYFHKNANRQAQQQLFEAQLHLAREFGLPILLHVRKAHDQVQAAIRRKHFSKGGIVHAFSGSRQQAEQYIKLGFKIAVGGTITYDRATKIRAVARALPLESIVLETDSPDIPPAQHHNERNSPEYLPLILDALAVIRPEPKSVLARATTENAISILQLKITPSQV
jgi:TatD DNase family protein